MAEAEPQGYSEQAPAAAVARWPSLQRGSWVSDVLSLLVAAAVHTGHMTSDYIFVSLFFQRSSGAVCPC